jgi:hypothetical protein
VAKKPVDPRRKRMEELKRRQQRSQRRGTILAIVISVLAGSGLIAGAYFASREEPAAPLDQIGVAASAAGCGELFSEDEKQAAGDHVPQGQTVNYAKVPPASGAHWDVQFIVPANRQFEDRDTEFQPEQYVHNLEHGYVVVWYDEDTPDDQLDQLREITTSDAVDRKFMVAPWPRGKFEGEKNVAITAWARQIMCDSVSGEAIQDFYDDYSVTGSKNVAPEKNAI